MSNCKVHHASGDADLLIVQKAAESATRVNTVLVGDDTDLLILLCMLSWNPTPYTSSQSQKRHQEPKSVGYHGYQETARPGDMHP